MLFLQSQRNLMLPDALLYYMLSLSQPDCASLKAVFDYNQKIDAIVQAENQITTVFHHIVFTCKSHFILVNNINNS